MKAYFILGIDVDADDTAIEAAYRKNVLKFPPDTCPEKFKQISQAYECIKTLNDRITYLMNLKIKHSTAATMTDQLLEAIRFDPMTSPGSLFFNIGSVATLSGFVGNWEFGTTLAAGANANVFTRGNFVEEDVNGLLYTATLNGRLVFDVDLSSVEVCPAELKAEDCKDNCEHTWPGSCVPNGRGDCEQERRQPTGSPACPPSVFPSRYDLKYRVTHTTLPD